ncbi:MAG: general secretion pathway protein GspK, partial [Planctomycetes bacterium]|nr:general secretion pathway protein GspK [Planctomycetota bacterium]
VTDDERIDGRVNINTASRVVLAALLGGGKEAEQLADNIITYRKGLTGGIESIAEIMKVNSMKIDTFKEIAQDITTRSDIYSVYSTAMSQADRRGVMARLQTEVVADRGAEPVAILYWYQGVSN